VKPCLVQLLASVLAVLCVLSGFALLFDSASELRADPVCAHSGVSLTLGSCGVPAGGYVCQTQTNETPCINPGTAFYQVEESFPIAFVYKLNSKASQTETACSRPCYCDWDPLRTPKCQTVERPNQLWASQPKRVEVECP